MRQLRVPRLVKKVLLMGLLLGGYVVADGGGQTVGACVYVWNSCNDCQGVYDETLSNCRGSCSYGDYPCWYTYCEAQAAEARDYCLGCCNP